MTSPHRSQLLRKHPVRCIEIFSCISDELRVAWVVDRFCSGDDFRQLGFTKVNILGQFSLCIRWSRDENCAGVCDRFSDCVKIVVIRRRVSAPNQLEYSIGMTIFERSSSGVRATDAGRDFLHLARSILEQVDSLVTRAHRTGRGEAGRLTIGFYTSLAAGNLRATLVDYARRFPELELGMIEGSRARLGTALRNGAVDIAIVTGETHLPHTKSMSLWSERILVVLPDGQLNSHNHNQHDSSPCFYLAVQIERPTSTRRYDISLLRNRASHVSAHAIPLNADRSPLCRSRAAEPSCARCKTCARSAMRMTIGRHCKRRPPHDLLI
jgi:DNA-binding transcriptional LysR family regulator